MVSGGFLMITYYGDFGAGGIGDAFDNVFKLPRHFTAVRGFSALTAHAGRHIFDNNNAAAHIGGKGRESILYRTLTHKASHFFLNGHGVSIA